MIKVKNIIKKYKDNIVLNKFNYEFNKGLYLVVGSSGKGKTTLLNILSGNDKRCKGKIKIEEEILYLKSKNNFVNDLRVKEVIFLFEESNETKLKSFFCIKDLYHKKIRNLSLGELQLLTLNIALSSSSKIIILDEPFSALSLENIKKACSFIESVSEDKLVIIASHNINYFSKFKLIDLEKKKKCKIDDFKSEIYKRDKEFKIKYYLLYLKKTFFRKIVFLLALFFAIYNFIYINNYSDNLINSYLKELEIKDGLIVEKENEIKEIKENVFYEVVKKLSTYVTNYNGNYYNSLLYEVDLSVDGLYIDNGFVLTSFDYIEQDLEEDEIILGLNYNNFCLNNKIFNCDQEYIKMILINKKTDNFPFKIKSIFYSNQTSILNNKRFNKLYDDNEYEEYYFDIKKENSNMVFEVINNDAFLREFDFVKVGENNSQVRYRVGMDGKKNLNNEIDYSKYIVCLELGYNCLNYINHFNSLISIDGFNNINKLKYEVIKEKLDLNDIIISSSLSATLNKKEGEYISFYFKYNESIKEVKLKINKIIESNEKIIYQNSEWSYLLFSDILKYENEDLQIKNILVYEDVKEGYVVSEDFYKTAIKEVRMLVGETKDIVLYINIGFSGISVVILVLLELFFNKLKKEYINCLKTFGIKKSALLALS